MLFAKSGPLDFPSFVAQESCGLQQLLKNHERSNKFDKRRASSLDSVLDLRRKCKKFAECIRVVF